MQPRQHEDTKKPTGSAERTEWDAGMARAAGPRTGRYVWALSRVRTDPSTNKRRDKPFPQFVADLPLIERRRLEPGANGGEAVGQRFDTDHLDGRQHERPPGRVAFHRFADLANRADDAVDVLG